MGDETAKTSPEDEEWVNRFKIFISKDGMEVKLRPAAAATEGVLTTFEAIIETCKNEGVKVPIKEELIKTQISQVNPEEVVIACGERPTTGQAGYIEYKVDMSAKPQFIADPKDGGSIDYKKSMQVTMVNIGDILAEIVPPTEGENGVNVFGSVLEAKHGDPAKYFLGEGLEEKDGKIVVTAAGTPSIQDDLLTIRRNYVLAGDVDLSSGNINFPGSVVIQGSVTDGFEVVSEENIIVNGLIANAKLKARGYVKCAGGIQGNGTAEIIAGSYVAVTFVNAANITAETDILITKDSLHSNLNCLGEIRLGGSLIGGVATAFNGISCANLGSEHGVKTIVNIRTHYRQEKAKELANSVLADVSTIYERYKIFAKQDSLSEADAKMLLQDITLLQALILKRQTFDSRAAKFDKIVLENKTARAKVLGILESDVTVASPYTKYVCMAPIKGPLSVSEINTSAKMAVNKGG